MIEYLENGDKAVIDGYSFRRDKKTGYYLSTVAIKGKRKRLHVYMWEKYNGATPQGYDVHHKDHNKSNNEIDNLEMLTDEEHHQRHREETTEEQRQKRIKNLEENARPKANEWHGSEEGRKWHKDHYEQMKEQMHRKQEYICMMCGKPYMAEITGQNKFCSNNCKAAYRRKSGVDNVERECVICGKPFISNKYSTAKYCEIHKGNRSRTRRVCRCV